MTKRNTPRISKCWRDPYRPSLEISQQQSTARQTARRSDVVPGPRARGGPARTIGCRGEAVARRRPSARRRGSEVRPSVPSLAIVAEPIGPARTGEYLVTTKAWPFRRPIVGRSIDGFLDWFRFEIHDCSPPRIAVHRHHLRAPFGLFRADPTPRALAAERPSFVQTPLPAASPFIPHTTAGRFHAFDVEPSPPGSLAGPKAETMSTIGGHMNIEFTLDYSAAYRTECEAII